MNKTGSGSAPDDGDGGTWTNETLPMSVRKELLERELKRMGFRKAGHGASGHDGAVAQLQQQPQGGSSHPSADAGSD